MTGIRVARKTHKTKAYVLTVKPAHQSLTRAGKTCYLLSDRVTTKGNVAFMSTQCTDHSLKPMQKTCQSV